MMTVGAFIDGMGERVILHSRVLGTRSSVTGWPNIYWSDSTIQVMVKRMSVQVRDTPSGTIEEARARLYTLSEVKMDDEVTYDGVRWRVEDVQFKHILLGGLGYYDVGILTPTPLYPAPTVIPSALDVFYPVMDPDAAVGAYPVISLANSATETVYHNLKVPSDFVSLISVNVIIIPGASGNMYYQGGVQWGKVCAGEAVNTHSGLLPGMKTTMYSGVFTCIGLTVPVSIATADDYIGGYFTRLGAHALDTVDATCYYCGVVLRYQA